MEGRWCKLRARPLSARHAALRYTTRRMSAVYALSAFIMTLAGGAFALRYRKYLLFIMAFSAGLLIGVAFLDLIPEVVEMAHRESIDIRALMITTIFGFAGIFLLEKLTIIHS